MTYVYDLLDPFDRGHGSGASPGRDDWTDEVTIFDNEWGSQAATSFNPHDMDGQDAPIPRRQQRLYERLYRLNNGYGEETRRHTINRSRLHNDMETFMSVLEMPDIQRETVRDIVHDYDMSSNASGGTRYEKLLLSICSLVSDEALSAQENPSVDDRLYKTERFRELMEVNDMTSSDHRRLRNHIREQSDYFDQHT
jgi:hypothetical protein